MSKVKVIAQTHQGTIEIEIPEKRVLPYLKKLLSNHNRELDKSWDHKKKNPPFLKVNTQKIYE